MSRSPLQPGDLDDLQKISGIAQAAGCYAPAIPVLQTHPTLWVSTSEVTDKFFSVFDARPYLGRTLQLADFESAAHSAVISFDLWQALLGRQPDIIGTGIELNHQTFTVVGVMPATFAPPCNDSKVRRQAWIPFDPTASSRPSHSALSVIARVNSGGSVKVVQAQLDAFGARKSEETGNPSYVGLFLQRVGEGAENAARPGILLLQTLAGCLLLIACANWGSLFLLDSSRRDTEFLTRAFLGASPSIIVRQLLLESFVIAVAGCALGVVLSLASGSQMRSLVAPVVPRGSVYVIEAADVITGLVIGLVVSSIFAALAAMIAARRVRHSAGKTAVQGTSHRSVKRFQDTLVALQVALSVVLAVATAIIGRSYWTVATTDTGVDARDVVTSILYLPPDSTGSGRGRVIQQSVADELRRVDGTVSVAFSDTPPFAGGAHQRVTVGDAPPEVPGSIDVNLRAVTPNYFDVLHIALRQGRALAEHSLGDVDEAIASMSFAGKMGGAQNLLGRVVRTTLTGRSYRIVGIAADVSTTWIWQPAEPTLYVGLGGTNTGSLSVLVRTYSFATTTQQLERVLAQKVPDAPEVTAEGLASIIWRSEGGRRFYLVSVGALAFVAIVIAGSGTYTAVRRMVALRTKEFAIRLSLGVAPKQLQLQVVLNAMTPVAVGILCCLMGALWLASWARSLKNVSLIIDVIFRTAPNVTMTAVGAAGAALVLAAFACWLPARQASATDPALLMKGN